MIIKLIQNYSFLVFVIVKYMKPDVYYQYVRSMKNGYKNINLILIKKYGCTCT